MPLLEQRARDGSRLRGGCNKRAKVSKVPRAGKVLE
jgi:hypothetical protein